MNLELNVVRFENEDVIATSDSHSGDFNSGDSHSADFCSVGGNVTHARVSGDLDGYGRYPLDWFRHEPEGWVCYENDTALHSSAFQETPNVGSYYISVGGTWTKCDGEHNPDVATKGN